MRLRYVNCDHCGRDAPARDECIAEGWYLSHAVEVSGIPYLMSCKDCSQLGEVGEIKIEKDDWKPEEKVGSIGRNRD